MGNGRRAPGSDPLGPAAAWSPHGGFEAIDPGWSVILVEGVSDRIAIEVAAVRTGRDLVRDAVAVVETGGAHGFGRALHALADRRSGARVIGIYDAGERGVVCRALERARMLQPDGDPERAGFFACSDDLEDELIRACGAPLVERCLNDNGDLARFQRMQRQPQWRARDETVQMRRWLAGGAERKLRYARILVEACPLERMPRPLTAALALAADRTA